MVCWSACAAKPQAIPAQNSIKPHRFEKTLLAPKRTHAYWSRPRTQSRRKSRQRLCGRSGWRFVYRPVALLLNRKFETLPWLLCMTSILGISAFYHDSAAALVVDGEIVAAAQQERFTRKKHDPAFPSNAIAYCLKEGNVHPEGLDYIAFYDKPLTKFDRLLETYLAYAPAGFKSFRLAMPLWLKDKLHMRRKLREALGPAARARLVFTDHHESHAASAFFPSPFERAAILTL